MRPSSANPDLPSPDPHSPHLPTHLYNQLRDLARWHLARERRGHTLQPTALVNEAMLRLSGDGHPWTDQDHFMQVAAQTLRRVLVDYARARNARKRGGKGEDDGEGGEGDDTKEKEGVGGGAGRVEIELDALAAPSIRADVLDVDEALHDLAALDPRKHHIVELKFFGGLTTRRIAAILGIATSTVENDWAMARAWLRCRLGVD